MSDEIETIDKNPKSWAAWKREAERLQAIIDDMVLAAMDSEPVAEITEDLGRLFVKIHYPTTLRAGDKLYRHAQPAPVVPDAYVRDERGRMMLNGVCEPKIGFGAGWNACRAAMLNHSGDATEKGAVIGIDLASGPDCSVEVRYVAPPGYVMVPKEPTAEMIWAAKYCFTSTPGWDVFKSAYIAMLAAAPQEVKGE
ncbi:hypothetical protein RFE02_002105 [Klebsiella pneumoniae]|nr:hypothetical protein [Klebsiella pneumoniae]